MGKRLDGWKKTYICRGGRLIVLNAVLASIPMYYLSFIKIVVKVANRIERMQRGFLWEGSGEGKKDHWVRWEVVSRPKNKGGLP